MDDQTIVEVATTATNYNSIVTGGLILPTTVIVLLAGLLMIWVTDSIAKSRN